MTTIRERCAQIKVQSEQADYVIVPRPDGEGLKWQLVEQPAPPVAAPLLAFDILEQFIDSDQATGACIIALVNGRLVASLGLRLREPGGFVHSVFVTPECRGRGIAEQLLRLAGDVAADHGKPTLGLSVNERNEPAKRLYRRLGFRPFTPAGPASTTWVAMLPLQEEQSPT